MVAVASIDIDYQRLCLDLMESVSAAAEKQHVQRDLVFQPSLVQGSIDALVQASK